MDKVLKLLLKYLYTWGKTVWSAWKWLSCANTQQASEWRGLYRIYKVCIWYMVVSLGVTEWSWVCVCVCVCACVCVHVCECWMQVYAFVCVCIVRALCLCVCVCDCACKCVEVDVCLHLRVLWETEYFIFFFYFLQKLQCKSMANILLEKSSTNEIKTLWYHCSTILKISRKLKVNIKPPHAPSQCHSLLSQQWRSCLKSSWLSHLPHGKTQTVSCCQSVCSAAGWSDLAAAGTVAPFPPKMIP